MKWLESIVAYSAPALLLDGTPWKNEWLEREKRSFIAVHTIWFACAIVGYVGHYFFFDRINGLEPLDFWFAFRMSMAGAMLLAREVGEGAVMLVIKTQHPTFAGRRLLGDKGGRFR